jgi:hypothetical protein
MVERIKSITPSSLNKYIRSKGTIVPKNIYAYTTWGDNSSLCPLCDELHENIPFTYRKTLTSEFETVNNVFICWPCNNVIEKHIFNRQDMFDNFSSRSVEAINKYMHEGIYPENVHQHFEHLAPEKEPFHVKSDYCIFCQSYLGSLTNAYDSKRIVIQVPLGRLPYELDGGKCSICTSCQYLMEASEQKVREIETNEVSDVCAKCTDIYAITTTEHDCRVAQKSLGQHCCPECAYLQMEDTSSIFTADDESDLMKMYRILRDSQYRIQRFAPTTCQVCDAFIELDLTFHPDHVLRNFISRTGVFCCPDCLVDDRSPISFVQNLHLMVRVYEESGEVLRMRVHSKSGKLLKDVSLESEEVVSYLFTLTTNINHLG